MSSAWMAVRSTGPMVGRLSTTDTITLPLTRAGNRYPMVLIMGLIATRTGDKHQPQQEVGHGEAAESQKSEEVVADGVLPDGGVDSYGDREGPGHDHRETRECDRGPDPIADDALHGALL